jgi:hypothetical protein
MGDDKPTGQEGVLIRGVLDATPKPWYQSKTVWLNGLTILALGLSLPEVSSIVPPAAIKYVAALNAVANLVLRMGGSQPLGKAGQ